MRQQRLARMQSIRPAYYRLDNVAQMRCGSWVAARSERAEKFPHGGRQGRVLHGHVHRGTYQAGLVATVEAGPLEAVRQHLALLLQQGLDRIGQLDLAAGTGGGLLGFSTM